MYGLRSSCGSLEAGACSQNGICLQLIILYLVRSIESMEDVKRAEILVHCDSLSTESSITPLYCWWIQSGYTVGVMRSSSQKRCLHSREKSPSARQYENTRVYILLQNNSERRVSTMREHRRSWQGRWYAPFKQWTPTIVIIASTIFYIRFVFFFLSFFLFFFFFFFYHLFNYTRTFTFEWDLGR